MAILCIARSIKIDFATWLQDSGEDLYVITSTMLPNQDRYRMVRFVDDHDVGGLTELTGIQIGNAVPFTHVLPHSEYDLIRAARLRQRFQIPGQTVESARAYRDKVVMKEHMQRAGIRVANFRRVESPCDVVEFVEEHGFPVVAKPTDGCSSKGVRVIAGHSELDHFLREQSGEGYMVESFVRGHMYHMNGVILADGSAVIIPGTYITTSLDFQTAGLYGERIIDPRTALARRLVAFTRKVIAALPAVPALGFHAEVFHTPEDELFLCEIASRTGGSLMGEIVEHSYGFNIHRAWIRACVGLDVDTSMASAPRQYTSSIRIPVRQGELRRLPRTIPFPWVSMSCVTGLEGNAYRQATSYTDDVLSALIAGSTEDQLKDRLAEFQSWLDETIRWT
jgi:biotin carboxylase